MKSNSFRIMVVIFLLFSITTAAIAGTTESENHNIKIEEILSKIRAEQNVKQNRDINPDLVSDPFLEQLGEAVMSLSHPDEKQHVAD